MSTSTVNSKSSVFLHGDGPLPVVTGRLNRVPFQHMAQQGLEIQVHQ